MAQGQDKHFTPISNMYSSCRSMIIGQLYTVVATCIIILLLSIKLFQKNIPKRTYHMNYYNSLELTILDCSKSS